MVEANKVNKQGKDCIYIQANIASVPQSRVPLSHITIPTQVAGSPIASNCNYLGRDGYVGQWYYTLFVVHWQCYIACIIIQSLPCLFTLFASTITTPF